MGEEAHLALGQPEEEGGCGGARDPGGGRLWAPAVDEDGCGRARWRRRRAAAGAVEADAGAGGAGAAEEAG